MPELSQDVGAAAERLRRSQLVAFPTETVYGLGADALSAEAVARVFALKGRPATNPLIVHVSGPEMAQRVVAEWPEPAARVAQALWPGPVTIVLPKRSEVPGSVTAGLDTVGVRCPDHPMALALVMYFGGPLVGPSANPSGAVSPTTAEHVAESFPGADLLVLDGGPCVAGIESTVVRLTARGGEVLRPGPIGPEEIEAAARVPVVMHDGAVVSGAAAAPGMSASHYAPTARVEVVEDTAVGARLREWKGGLVVALLWAADAVEREGIAVIRMPEGDAAYASELYAALRGADALRPELILVERPPDGSALWRAVRDRLRRASHAG